MTHYSLGYWHETFQLGYGYLTLAFGCESNWSLWTSKPNPHYKKLKNKKFNSDKFNEKCFKFLVICIFIL